MGYLNVFLQCLNDVINAEFPNDQAIIGQNEVIYIAQGDLLFELTQISDCFQLFKNNILQSNNVLIAFSIGDVFKIVPINTRSSYFRFFL